MSKALHGLKTTTEVRRELGLAEYVVENLIRQRAIPEPDKLGGRRVWTEAEVENLRDVLRGRGFDV